MFIHLKFLSGPVRERKDCKENLKKKEQNITLYTYNKPHIPVLLKAGFWHNLC